MNNALGGHDKFIFVAQDISHPARGDSNATGPGIRQIRSSLIRDGLQKRRRDSIRKLWNGSSLIKPQLEETSAGKRSNDGAQTILSLSNEKIDPFATFPIALDEVGHELISYWFGIRRRSVRHRPRSNEILHQMQKTNFIAVMQYPLSFQKSMIELAALHQAEAAGNTKSRSVLKEKQNTIKMLSATVRNLKTSDIDDLIMGVSGAAINEDRYSNREAARAHMKAAVQIIELRGGLSGFTGMRKVFRSRILWSLYKSQLIARSGKDGQMDYDSLVAFVRRRASQAARSCSEMLQHQSMSRLLVCHSELIREQHSPLWNTVMYCSITVLIYIITVILDYGDDQAKIQRFAENTVQKAAVWGLNDGPDMNVFLWMLIHEENQEDEDSHEQSWRAFKILNAIKRLPFASQVVLRSFFYNLLLRREDSTADYRRFVMQGALEIIRRDSTYSEERSADVTEEDGIGTLDELSIPRGSRII